MDLVRTSIPYEFLRPLARLTWREVLFGLEQQLLDERAPVDMGVERLMEEENPSLELVELAGIVGNHDIRPLVKALSGREPEQPTDAISQKWLYLVLAWFFDRKDDHPDALQAVEEVYADFGYPEAVVGFVRYMPSVDPDLGRQGNEARLLERWKMYLDRESERY